MKKKKFLACVGMLGLALTSLFVSPIKSKAYSEETSTALQIRSWETFDSNFEIWGVNENNKLENWGNKLFITKDAVGVYEQHPRLYTDPYMNNEYLIVIVGASNSTASFVNCPDAINLSGVYIYVAPDASSSAKEVIQKNQKEVYDDWSVIAIPQRNISEYLEMNLNSSSSLAIMCGYADLFDKEDTNITKDQINEYIKGKTNPGPTWKDGTRYYLYDVLVNRTGMWDQEECNIYYHDDEIGCVSYDGSDWESLSSFTLKKGKAYMFNMMYYENWQRLSSSQLISQGDKKLECNKELEEIFNFTTKDMLTKCEYIEYIGCDMNVLYEDDSGYTFPEDSYDICQEIDNLYQEKLKSIYTGYNNFMVNGANYLIIPNLDITLTINQRALQNYPGGCIEIGTADITPLSNTPDTTAPSIEGENIYINVDNPLTFEQIKTHFSSYDETDGDLTDRLEFTDNTYILTNGKIACGTYSFKVSVSDTAGNTTTKLYYAHVVDYTDPTITTKTINVSYTHKLTVQEIMNLFEYSDNYTPTNQLIFRYTSDNYSDNYQELGEHTITAKVLDQQGNDNSATAIINVIDDVAPFMVLPENLKITTLDNWNLDSFRKYITVTDEKEGNITDFELTDLDGYLNETKKAGTYRIKVVAADSVGNSIEKTFSFENEDKDMPSITIDPDYVMVVNQGDSITKEQVINYFLRTGQLTLAEAEDVEVISLYFDATPQAGCYMLSLRTEGKIIESKIEVLADGTGNDQTDPTAPKDPIKPAKNKFLSTEGYGENFFHPSNWSIYHYLTLVGMFVVLGTIIFIVWKKH